MPFKQGLWVCFVGFALTALDGDHKHTGCLLCCPGSKVRVQRYWYRNLILQCGQRLCKHNVLSDGPNKHSVLTVGAGVMLMAGVPNGD